MKRNIIKIDEELCNGCGLCIPNCHEGALQIIDGKARLVSDLFCDGLGACLGHCPEGAISIEEREAEPYNETLVMEQMVKKGKNTVLAHLHHLKSHGADDFLAEAIAYIKKNNIDLDVTRDDDEVRTRQVVAAEMAAAASGGCGSGCPGTAPKSFAIDMNQVNSAAGNNGHGDTPSQLTHWPVQLHLLNPMAPFFKNADVVLAADCAAFAMGNFHDYFLKGKILAIACPKLDSGQEAYLQKLVAMIDEARINSFTVVRMEVPCCGGLTRLAQMAVANASRKVPVKQAVVDSRGKVLSEDWI
ncbi:4Fe-4S ferredoxin [Candidatus Falkowbacteria bacterium]|jgi:ferredoxin|nr:4Fe-4S binding protein [Bacteroidales bacterium]MDD4177523.1 4Fe-4S binding protein [Bacteroidales bacterium]MDD4741839.1 4Fe-4S binding protein [Bacteroidales bacterium]NCU36537.1 4Fe-4S ferredoxin [Candidatus Falkowbacteria bacterium]